MVILITGRASSGKSTHAKRLAQEYKAKGLGVSVLDGDVYRAINQNDDFTDLGRYRNLKGLAETAQMIEASGRVCIVACIAPRREWRDMMRGYWRESRLVYLPGGTLWANSTYEEPTLEEFDVRR